MTLWMICFLEMMLAMWRKCRIINLVVKLQKNVEDNHIYSVIASAGTNIICIYCPKKITLSTAVGHFCNQCKEMMGESGGMKDYCKAIKTKNECANDSFKSNNAKCMAKFCNLKKEEWYTFKNMLLKPPMSNLYPKLTSLNIFIWDNELEKKRNK